MLKKVICGIGAMVIFGLACGAGYNYGYYKAKDECDEDNIYYGTVYLNEEDLQNEVKIGDELPFSTRETKIRDEYADFDSILLNAVVYPDFTFDYNKNSKMYIGWTHDPHGDRDYVIWYDDELPDADWWTNHC